MSISAELADLRERRVPVKAEVPSRRNNGRSDKSLLNPSAYRGRVCGYQGRKFPCRDIHVWLRHTHQVTHRVVKCKTRRAVLLTTNRGLRDLHDYAKIGYMNTKPEANWIPDASTFGARLALVRWRMGWNIREAERECGLSQNTWAGWEHGATPRDFVEVVSKIHWATGVNRVWLMTGEGSPEPRESPEPPTSTVKAHEFERSNGDRGTSYTTRVQSSGVDFIRRKLGLGVAA